MQLQLAQRQQVKLRMSISAPTGFGKTYSALLIAFGITGDWSKICVVDTENQSASLYSDLGLYYTIPLAPPYTTEKYIQAIDVCEKGGIEVIILDSVTHVWKGEGGLLEYNNSLGGRYQDWAKTTPLYQKWLNRILHSSCHIITTMRKKQAYALVNEGGGKPKVEKQGMEDEIRDGYDYEMTVAFEIINDKHMARAAKDRTRLFTGGQETVLTSQTGELIRQWCESGVDVKEEVDKAIAGLGNVADLDELALFRETLQPFVLTDPRFKEAGNARFLALKKASTDASKPATEPAT
ncbi:MAG: AAA family ATPase [Sphingobacteriales bacterium]|nr:MAG: AAA family ATPase [Sphingobacteriales bacterium]